MFMWFCNPQNMIKLIKHLSSCFLSRWVTHNYAIEENISSRFSDNSEASASELFENLEVRFYGIAVNESWAQTDKLSYTISTVTKRHFFYILKRTLRKFQNILEEVFHRYHMHSYTCSITYYIVLLVFKVLK